MGFSISWLAANENPETVRELLGLQLTEERVGLFEAPLTGAQLPGSWYLVGADGCEHVLISEPVLSRLSEKAEVVACSVEEHVMVSAAAYWGAGRKIWSVAHDAQRAIDHLDIEGAPPRFFAEVRDEALARQTSEGGVKADVDYVFDVPLELARRIVGFKHDAVDQPERSAVLRVSTTSPLARRKPWWRFW